MMSRLTSERSESWRTTLQPLDSIAARMEQAWPALQRLIHRQHVLHIPIDADDEDIIIADCLSQLRLLIATQDKTCDV